MIVLGLLAVALSACSTNASPTPGTPTRAATQTPWIIYVPVTTTPEPAIATPLPTIGAPAQPTARATATRAPVVAVKPSATKPLAAPVAPAAPAATAPPACSLGTVKLTFPENGARRDFKVGGTGGPAFELKWDPAPNLPFEAGDPAVGYKIEVIAKKKGSTQVVNSATYFIAHNKFINEKRFIIDARSARALTNEDDASVSWQVTVIKAGGFDDAGGKSGTEIVCGAPSAPSTIEVVYQGG